MFWSASTRRCKLQHFVVRFTARWPCNAEILSAEHPKIGNHKYNHKQTSNENPPTSITISTPPHLFPKVLMKIIENPKTSATFSIPSPHRPAWAQWLFRRITGSKPRWSPLRRWLKGLSKIPHSYGKMAPPFCVRKGSWKYFRVTIHFGTFMYGCILCI